MNVLRIIQGPTKGSEHPDGSIVVNESDELMAEPYEHLVMLVVDMSEVKFHNEYPGKHKEYIVGTFMGTNKLDYQIVFRGASLHIGLKLGKLINREVYIKADKMCTKQHEFWLWSAELVSKYADD